MVVAGPGSAPGAAEVAAPFYTLFESAKLAGVDPHAYALKAIRRAIASPGAVTRR